MHKYLSLRHSSKEGDDTEVQKKVMFCFRVISNCFGDSAKAQENFQILDQLKDGNVWKISTRLIDPNTSALQASSLRHQLYDHFREFLLDARVLKCSGSTELVLSCMAILVMRLRHLNAQLGQHRQQHEDTERARQQDLDVDDFINRKLAAKIRRQKAQWSSYADNTDLNPNNLSGTNPKEILILLIYRTIVKVSVFPAVKATVEVSTQVTSGGRREPQGTRC
ncbi:hypothetical protein CASFOL_031598 [Castilleja foliolosa]|uniref:Uncharacterized protein n=1 Tax=Castilleja foliolosa TaxID=1961234 RepID=A0ABD3C551_9LAMI